jgi:uncharacterized protein (UPF0333 family)
MFSRGVVHIVDHYCLMLDRGVVHIVVAAYIVAHYCLRFGREVVCQTSNSNDQQYNSHNNMNHSSVKHQTVMVNNMNHSSAGYIVDHYFLMFGRGVVHIVDR